MADDPNQFRPLYYPKTAEELLTKPILEMLMLGFTIGFDNTAVALYDRQNRYDLGPSPEKYWQNFCESARTMYGLDEKCKEKDRAVANLLLDGAAAADKERFLEPFPCHLGMIDMAHLIRIAGIPFAVLLAGQIRSPDAGWETRVRSGLEQALPGRPDAVRELLEIARRDTRAVDDPDLITKNQDCLKEFAGRVEELLNNLYNERRSASGEKLLKTVSDRLLQSPAPDWDTFWTQLGEVLAKVAPAAGVDRIAFLQGSAENPFRMELRASSNSGVWHNRTASIGSYWEQIRHSSMRIDGQTWSPSFREGLGIAPAEPCVLATTICRSGLPPLNQPSLLVSVGEDTHLPAVDGFVKALAEEIGKVVNLTSDRLEVDTVKREAESFAAYAGHDVKSALHAAFNLATSVGYEMGNQGMMDDDLLNQVASLNNALREASDKARSFAKQLVREMKIECELSRMDVVPIIDRGIELAKNLEPDKGITVTWGRRPHGPVYLDLDKQYFSTALLAVLDNAVKYSFAGKDVRVSTSHDAAFFILEVSNYGVGIAPEVKLNIWEFGTRGHVEDVYKSRGRAGGGLGLPIVRRIIDAHRGTVEITSVSTKGSPPETDDYKHHKVTAVIRLPLPGKGS